MRTVNRWLAILAVPVAFATSGLAIPAPALAADAAAPAAKHVVALYTEGPKTTDARELITAALGQEAEVVDPAALKKALAAKGRSTIYNIRQIDRGYVRIDDKLRALGASDASARRRRTSAPRSR